MLKREVWAPLAFPSFPSPSSGHLNADLAALADLQAEDRKQGDPNVLSPLIWWKRTGALLNYHFVP